MKNKISISEIARRLGISKSTVSKALGNKPGVDDETKKNIVKYAKSVGYFLENKLRGEVVVMLPERYKNLCAEVQKELGASARCGVYLNREDYLKNLASLIGTKPAVAVVYPMHTEGGDSLLKKLENIWFIGDYINFENAFFFGSSPVSDARKMADCFLKSELKAPVFIHSYKSVMNARRTEIFAKALAEKGIYPTESIYLDKKEALSAPIIAREMDVCCNKADCIYCGDETYQLVKKALIKIGREDLPVFSYDDEQNLRKAIAILAENIKTYLERGDYPPCKYNFI